MAIDPSIALQVKTADPLNALAQGFQVGNAISQAPMQKKLNEQKLAMNDMAMEDTKQKMQRSAMDYRRKAAVMGAAELQSAPVEQWGAILQDRIKGAQRYGYDAQAEQEALEILNTKGPEALKGTIDGLVKYGTTTGIIGAGNQASVAERYFNQMTQGMTPEEVARAKRIELGLDPRAVASAPGIVDIGGVKHVVNPMSGAASLPVLNQPIPGGDGQGSIPPPVPGGQQTGYQQPTVLDANAVASNAATIEKQTTIAKGEGEQAVQTQKSMKDEVEVNRLLDKADGLIDVATGSKAGQARDAALSVFGVSTSAGDAAAELRTLEGALIMKMPRMEGPQSNLDQQLYRQMAAQVGDPSVPASQKKAAMGMLRSIMSKYQKPEDQQVKEQPKSAQPQIQEGATATNPQTGQKIIFRGGQWQPM